MHVYVLALCSTCLICMSGVLSVSIFHMKKKKKKSELLTCLMIWEIFNGPCHWSEFPSTRLFSCFHLYMDLPELPPLFFWRQLSASCYPLSLQRFVISSFMCGVLVHSLYFLSLILKFIPSKNKNKKKWRKGLDLHMLMHRVLWPKN